MVPKMINLLVFSQIHVIESIQSIFEKPRLLFMNPCHMCPIKIPIIIIRLFPASISKNVPDGISHLGFKSDGEIDGRDLAWRCILCSKI